MTNLAKESCEPCKSGAPPLGKDEISLLLRELEEGWTAPEGKRIEKEYKFPDFLQALAFVNRVGGLAESVGHHPDVYLAWGKVKLTLWTHSIGGLSRSDFVFAAKADQLL